MSIYYCSTEFINTREEGKALIREIALKRTDAKSGTAETAGGQSFAVAPAAENGAAAPAVFQEAVPRPLERLRSVAGDGSPNFGGPGGTEDNMESPRREFEPVNLTFTP